MKPTLVPPQEKVRRLTDGKWELKAVIDDECERGLAELKRLLSHTNASMTYGEPGNWWDGWRMLRRPGAAPRGWTATTRAGAGAVGPAVSR